MTVVKFPYSTSRRVYARRPTISKNGTPEERAAIAAEAEIAVMAGKARLEEEVAQRREKKLRAIS
jgi:hypothetical protein